MPATATSRIDGLTTSVAIKAPCLTAATAHVALYGTQTINGVAVTDGDRVLVTAQTDPVENGIYVCTSTDWYRALDFNGARDAVTGTQVLVVSGSGLGSWYRLTTTDDPIVFGTSSIVFVLSVFGDSATINFLQAGTGAVSRTGQAKMRDIVSVKDFGALGDGLNDDTAEIQAAIDSFSAGSGGHLWFPKGVYLISSALSFPASATGYVFSGDGKYNTIIRTNSATANIFTAPSTAQLIVIEDMQLDSLTARSAGAAIAFTGTQQFRLSRLRIVDTYNVMTLTDVGNGIIEDIQVAHGAGNLNRGIYLQGAIDLRLDKLVFNGGNVTMPTANAWLTVDSGCDTIDVDHCLFLQTGGTAKGMIVSHSLSPASFPPEWVKVNNTYIEASTGTANANAQDGITISSCTNVYFVNCYVATSRNGVVVTGGEDIRFNHLIILNCDRHGISLATTDIISITDTTISDCSQQTANTYDGINIASTATNVIMDDLYIGDAILTSATRMRYGVNNASANCMLGTCLFGNFGTSTANGIVGPMSGTYTPTWTGATIGNGAISGDWFRTEKGIAVNIAVSIGTTTVIPAGQFIFSLPFATTSTLNVSGSFNGICAGLVQAGAVRLGGTGSTVLLATSGAVNYVTSLIPGTWAAGDSISATITYQHRP